MAVSGGVAFVVNPRTRAALAEELWQQVRALLQKGAERCDEVETQPDDGNAERVIRLIETQRPHTIVAAGGDGTVSEVVQAIRCATVSTAPTLAILPLGTANNVARSLGLRSCRPAAADAVDLAVATARGGALQPLDLGYVETGEESGRYFIGSFAIGMDAHILQMRNRLRRRLALGPRTGGYPLYLLSCAVCLLLRRPVVAALRIDGVSTSRSVFNFLVLNTPLYAGEFRFDAGLHVDDARLDLQVFAGALDYVRQFVAAWRRHLRAAAGRCVTEPPGLRRIVEVEVNLPAAAATQLDGEERTPSAAYRIRVVPRALVVRVPASVRPPAAGSSR